MKDKRTRKIKRSEGYKEFDPLLIIYSLTAYANVFHISFPPSVLASLLLCDAVDVKTIKGLRAQIGGINENTLIRLQRSGLLEKINETYKPTERGKEAIERYYSYIQGQKIIGYKINLSDKPIKEIKKTTFNPFVDSETKNNTRKKQLKQQAKHKRQ